MYEEARRKPGFFFARKVLARMKMIDPLCNAGAIRRVGERACEPRAQV